MSYNVNITRVVEDEMIHVLCGASVETDRGVCWNCRRSLAPEMISGVETAGFTPPTERPQSDGGAIAGLFIIVVIIAAIVGLLWLIKLVWGVL